MTLLSTLTLFPPYSLDTSILVAVLVGVVILALLTETLGWVFVGLVVPGYLASILVVHPEAGATVVLEAILTYLLALGLSAGMSRTGAWSKFFGRDRFFLIVLASVLVRAVSEVWLMPHVGRALDARFGTTFTLDRSLHSIGLVLVPLTANAFWKLKLPRGLLQVGVPVLLTYALLRWVLLPGTNLSFSNLELTYEDIAQSFLASPKAYIILLVTALLAARFNLLYGWDFNGILVPALVALTWLEPLKLVATLAEVMVLVAGTRALLSLPGLRTFNLEGPRKTVLVFALGFLLKGAIGWALGGRVPGLKVTDLFGFGYLVPTLLAVKILQKQVVGRIVFATLHTSLAGFLVGSLVGFGLSLVEPKQAVATAAESREVAAPSLELARSPLGVMVLARATARETGAGELPLRHTRAELRRYEQLWRTLDGWLKAPSPEQLAAAREHVAKLGLELHPVPPSAPEDRPRFLLLERKAMGKKAGWDTALLVPGAPGPVLEVPRPLSEAPTAEAAAVLCERVQCRAVLVSGVDTRAAGLWQGDALLERRTPLQTAHAVLSGERVQLRADPTLRPGVARVHGEAKDLALFSTLWPGAERSSEEPPEPGATWGEPRLGMLRAHPHDLLSLVSEDAAEAGEALSGEALYATLMPPGTPAPAAPHLSTDAELLVLEQQVAAPLLGSGPYQTLPEPMRLAWARTMARLLELELRPVDTCGGDGACWLLSDRGDRRGRLGAGLLVQLGGRPLALEAPVPAREPGSLPVALELFRSTRARALVFVDPVSKASADPLHPASPGVFQTPFQALHQAVHRALPGDEGFIVQIRGFSGRPGLAADVLVDLDELVLEPAQRPERLEALLAEGGPLAWLKPFLRYHDGSPELAGLSVASPQAAFTRTFRGTQLATLWFSERMRGAYVSPRRTDEVLTASGLAELPLTTHAPEASLLGKGLTSLTGPLPPRLQRRFDALAATAERMLTQQSVHDLRELARTRKGSQGEAVQVHWSPAHGQPYLFIEARAGRRLMRGVYFLQQHPSPVAPVRLEAGRAGVDASMAQALRQRTPVLVRGELPAEEARR